MALTASFSSPAVSTTGSDVAAAVTNNFFPTAPNAASILSMVRAVLQVQDPEDLRQMPAQAAAKLDFRDALLSHFPVEHQLD